MSSGKRYFWLKLKEDFFTSKRIKKLRNMAGGDTYLIIYLKLQLKAMKTNGIIRFDHLEDNIVDELALDIDEKPDNVAATLIYLTHCGLAQSSNDETLFLPYSVENVGSEASSAQRMRELRERQKALVSDNEASQCDTCVTPPLQISDGEIEKEIETDIEIDNTDSKESVCRTGDVRRVKEAWNSLGLSQISTISADTTRGKSLKARINQNGVETVLKAMDNIRRSSFLQGQNKSGWTITFDWFVKPNNFIKVLEGQYDDRKTNTDQRNTASIDFTEILREG